MQRVLKHIEDQDLTGSEMTTLLAGVASMKLYNTLSGATPSSFFEPHAAVALLFPVESTSSGHWIGMWKNEATKTVHHFDSYGLTPQQEDQYSSQPEVQERLLQQFYQSCMREGYRVLFNQTRYQQMDSGNNTCGRHVVCRLRLSYLADMQYAKLMSHDAMTPDNIVTLMTFLPLNEDSADKAELRTVL